MKIIYMGTPQFAVPPLQALVDAGHTILGVVTRIDKPAGRGRALAAPPVKLAAQEKGLMVFQPKRVRDPKFIEALGKINPEVIVVAAYGQILPKEVLSLPKYGCINIHASLLPKYRGAAPINWAIINGETVTGNTIMRMDEGMDTGDILMQESIHIAPKDTAGMLIDKLSRLGAALITSALPLIEAGTLAPKKQDASQATLAPLLKKEAGLIHWDLPAGEIHNRVRGFNPWPGAYTFLETKLVKVLETETVAGSGEPGVIYLNEQQQLDIGTGKDVLRILRLQPEGKKPMTAEEFLRGHRGIAGKRFNVSR